MSKQAYIRPSITRQLSLLESSGPVITFLWTCFNDDTSLEQTAECLDKDFAGLARTVSTDPQSGSITVELLDTGEQVTYSLDELKSKSLKDCLRSGACDENITENWDTVSDKFSAQELRRRVENTMGLVADFIVGYLNKTKYNGIKLMHYVRQSGGLAGIASTDDLELKRQYFHFRRDLEQFLRTIPETTLNEFYNLYGKNPVDWRFIVWNLTESHEDHYKYIKFREGHRNAEGDLAEWVITQKGTGKILSSHSTRDAAIDSFQAIMAHKHGA